MQVTFTNATSDDIYMHPLRVSVPAGETRTARRTLADLDREVQAFKDHVVAGEITLAFAHESGDAARLGASSAPVAYTNLLRPAANTVPTYTAIWNIDDAAMNWSDGTNWRDATGTIT